MQHKELTPARDRSLRNAIRKDRLCEETAHVRRLARRAKLLPGKSRQVRKLATRMINDLRRQKNRHGGLDRFLQEYSLSTEEGAVMMGLAEALLRIPDTATRDRLIHDCLQRADWHSHLGHSDSLLVDATTWALLLSGRVMRIAEGVNPLDSTLKKLLARSGEPVIRESIIQAMRVIGGQFVCGESIEAALKHAADEQQLGYRHSFDMLGEAALTAADADRYQQAYRDAILALAAQGDHDDVLTAPGISVKLSALHPRFEPLQAERLREELPPILLDLALMAKAANIGLTVDAEEARHLELTLDCFATVYRDTRLSGWDGLGLAVQAYQKRAPAVIDWLQAQAEDRGRRIPVRLVKGAYWDSEIKHAQQLGLAGYPVYTRKSHTDVSYLACIQQLFKAGDALLPQFATHNAHSLAAVQTLAPRGAVYECQRLHGMGQALYDPLVEKGLPCRIYAPVGDHSHLLAYLIRRLLENGANTSFLHHVQDKGIPVARLAQDPVATAREHKCQPHPQIPLPAHVYGEQRRNAAGFELGEPAELMEELRQALKKLKPVEARPLIRNWLPAEDAKPRSLPNPARRDAALGSVIEASPQDAHMAMDNAARFAAEWNTVPVTDRAAILDKAAEQLELFLPKYTALVMREAGKPWPAALAEVREAVNLCRYYAAQARETLSPKPLPGPAGERNLLVSQGRGPMLCISPWNFPLAIFVGQVAAALVAGNTVLSKPARQTPLTAYLATRLFHKAGVPKGVLQLLPGVGDVIGRTLLDDPRLEGVLFTGSFAAAKTIQGRLAARPGPILPFIAETGGVNAMLVDSTALPEQVVQDALRSAFDSAGQRCSALRLLCLQEDVAERIEAMLAGALAEWRIDDPAHFATDVGPVIDAAARDKLNRHLRSLRGRSRLIAKAELVGDTKAGGYFAPRIIRIEHIDQLRGEVFGPVLHVLRYPAKDFESLVEAINAKGYGLTAGLHSRLISRQEQFGQTLRAGNLYINRDLIGAVPGVQPFGGMGLSGTGPKAGGPHYLTRLVQEQTLCVNSAATGGSTQLLTLQDDH